MIEVVIPFCPKDGWKALELLRWAAELGGARNHQCSLLADALVPWELGIEVLSTARKVFSRARLDVVGPFTEGWPVGANRMFLEAAQRARGPFLWLEPDCVPLKAGWMDAIEKAYVECGHSYMGRVTRGMLKGAPCTYLPGAGTVWPADSYGQLAELIAAKPEMAFDVAVRHKVTTQAWNTLLVQYVWGAGGDDGPSFGARTNTDVQGLARTNVMGLDQIHPQAVLFHRNKDGSLIRLLREKLFPRTVTDTHGLAQTPAFVQLGRLGDLCLLLPAFAEWARRSGAPVNVVAAEEFGTILHGCSYVRPHLWKLNWHNDLNKAIALARQLFPRVVCTQLHGAGVSPPPDALPSYSMTMWLRTGFSAEDYARLPLIFDRRDPGREAVLAARHTRGAKPVLLASLESWTSPLPSVNALRRLLAEVARDFCVVHLPMARGAKPYDQLGLMDRAVGLITIDTFALHLAAASRVPVIALIRDDGQSGSIPRCNTVLKVGYQQVGEQMDRIRAQVGAWADGERAMVGMGDGQGQTRTVTD